MATVKRIKTSKQAKARKQTPAGNLIKRINPAVVKQHLPLLNYLTSVKGRSPAQKKAIIRAAGPNFSRAICSICKNIEVGKVTLPRKPTKREATMIRRLARGNQRGGFLPAILPVLKFAIPAVASLLGGVFGGKE